MLLSLIPLPGLGQTESESVSLLVRSDRVDPSLRAQTADESTLGWERIVVPVDGSPEQTARELERELGVTVVVETSYPLLGGESEPLFPEQWALENDGSLGGVADADIDVRRAWQTATGHGVVVAVVDSGVESSHPDLVGQMWQNTGEVVNGVDDDGNGFTDDIMGWDFEDGDNDPGPEGSGFDDAHGTLIAGVIGAAVNGTGMSGVAPDARIMAVKACDEGACLTLDAIRAISYAVDNGADIVNLSFGGPSPINSDEPLADALAYARSRDVLVVTAAGNTPPSSLGAGLRIVPAELPHSNNVAVAATDRSDRVASFSYFGPNIDIAAPGDDILAPDVSGYATVSGTSFSAPVVAGVAALLLSDDPNIGHRELVARLLAWTNRPSGVSGKVASGRVNAGDLLKYRFVDTRNHTFEADAKWAADTGVTQGCNPPENTTFCPDEPVTREQMAAFLRRYLKLPPATRDHFGDDNGSTFEDDINRLAEAGITRGCNPPANNRYCPKNPVTREEMAAFLVRALSLTADKHPGFVDVAATNTFRADIEKLATAGITRGCNPPANDRYCPRDEVTRGQMTAFLRRS